MPHSNHKETNMQEQSKKHPAKPNSSMGRAFNTSENAIRAAATAKAALPTFQPGRVWNHTAPKGESEIKGALNHNQEPVIMLRFSPVDGSLLPKGLHGLNQSTPETIAIVEKKLKEIAVALVVLDGAEFREPECCWALPIAHQGRIVAHLKVSADGTTIQPDRKALEELLGL